LAAKRGAADREGPENWCRHRFAYKGRIGSVNLLRATQLATLGVQGYALSDRRNSCEVAGTQSFACGLASMSIRIFLSTVSDEFREYRDQLRRDLTRHNVEVKVQEDFKDLGSVTLDKLENDHSWRQIFGRTCSNPSLNRT
jgi:hypothetical protein